MSPMFHFYVVSSFFPNEEFFHNVFFCFVLFLLVLILKYVHCGERKTKILEAIDNYQEDNMSMVDSLGGSIDNS